MSSDTITIHCGGCGCLTAVFLIAATTIGLVSIFHFIAEWFA